MCGPQKIYLKLLPAACRPAIQAFMRAKGGRKDLRGAKLQDGETREEGAAGQPEEQKKGVRGSWAKNLRENRKLSRASSRLRLRLNEPEGRRKKEGM